MWDTTNNCATQSRFMHKVLILHFKTGDVHQERFGQLIKSNTKRVRELNFFSLSKISLKMAHQHNNTKIQALIRSVGKRIEITGR